MNIEAQQGVLLNAQHLEGMAQKEQIKGDLALVESMRDDELRELGFRMKSLQQMIWDIKSQHHKQQHSFVDPLLRDQMNSMYRLIGLKRDGIKQLEEDKYNQAVDREKLVVLHKYQESGVEVHHAYSKYIQSENLKSLRDLPHSYKLIVYDLEMEIERKNIQKKFMEEQKRHNEELMLETRKKIEEATSFHHSLQKQLDQQKN